MAIQLDHHVLLLGRSGTMRSVCAKLSILLSARAGLSRHTEVIGIPNRLACVMPMDGKVP